MELWGGVSENVMMQTCATQVRGERSRRHERHPTAIHQGRIRTTRIKINNARMYIEFDLSNFRPFSIFWDVIS